MNRSTARRLATRRLAMPGALLLALLLLAACQQTSVPEDPTNHPPEVNLIALPDSGPAPLTVELNAQGSDVDGDLLTYHWDINDESFEGEEVREYTFPEPGEYTATVTVSDGTTEVEDEASIIVFDDDEAGL